MTNETHVKGDYVRGDKVGGDKYTGDKIVQHYTLPDFSLNNLPPAQPQLHRPYYEQALAILEARLGPDHPHTKIVRGNLAALDE